MIKIWLDDLRKPPGDYLWVRSVNEAIHAIESAEKSQTQISVIDCDHDLGDYANDGGDGIKLLDWLEAYSRCYRIRLHTMNPVGRENMRRIIRRNQWKEVF